MCIRDSPKAALKGGFGEAVVECDMPVSCELPPLGKPRQLVGKSAGLAFLRLRVRIPAGAAGEFSSPESTLCAASYSVSVTPPCYRSGT